MKLKASDILDGFGLACVMLVAALVYSCVFAPAYLLMQIINHPLIVALYLAGLVFFLWGSGVLFK